MGEEDSGSVPSLDSGGMGFCGRTGFSWVLEKGLEKEGGPTEWNI